MHDDPIAARRTIAGGQVVHGIHQVLAAVEAGLAHLPREGSPARGVAEVKAVFKKPVLVEETVIFHLTRFSDGKCKIAGRMQGENVCEVTIGWGEMPTAPQIELPPLAREAVADLGFDQLAGKAGSLELGLDKRLAEEMFPLAMCALGGAWIAEVLSLSRLVGMHCPGLHSIFGQCAVNFRERSGGKLLEYQVDRTDERFGTVLIEVKGPRVQGELTVYYRPPPERQPGMTEVRAVVEPGCFKRSVALIVGGSRGLGEVTARLIAAGGGLAIITYHQGAADAEGVAAEIRGAGGRCEVLQLDVRQSDSLMARLTAGSLSPRSVYYFATPRIFGRRRSFFGHDLLREFEEVYVTAFGRLIDRVAASCGARLRVFYPSSVAVTEPPREIAEYAMAKRTGEEMCAFYNRHGKQIEIVVERLPRTRTDQTSTILPAAAEDGLKVMLPHVMRMEGPCQE